MFGSGVKSGCEAAVYATREILEKHDVEATLLLFDATNAFNSLKRKVVLHNIKYVCPALKNILTNCYQSQIHLFIPGDGEVTFHKATTQGDPLGMAMFALAMVHLINKLFSQGFQICLPNLVF